MPEIPGRGGGLLKLKKVILNFFVQSVFTEAQNYAAGVQCPTCDSAVKKLSFQNKTYKLLYIYFNPINQFLFKSVRDRDRLGSTKIQQSIYAIQHNMFTCIHVYRLCSSFF